MKQLLEVLRLIPAIVEAMKVAETIAPLPGQGSAKLNFVLGVLTDMVGDVSALVTPITKVIARITNLFNTTGTFSKEAQ